LTTLLIASAGGHLTQLHRLRPRLQGIDQDVIWVTFDGPQSRSLLADEKVVHAHYPRPRDAATTVRNAALAHRLLSRYDVRHAVSTGAGVALSFFAVAAARGVRCHYVESATRLDGPSLTGRLVRRVPRVELYSQYRSWARPPWHYRGSVFDGYRIVEGKQPSTLKRVVVSVGSSETFGFRRLLERMVTVLRDHDIEVLWQTGPTDTSGLPFAARPTVPAIEMQRALREADVVVSHAGTGSALTALEAGKYPMLVPRRRSFGEHIDDHQLQIVRELTRRNLAHCREAEEITFADLLHVAGRQAEIDGAAPAFELGGAAAEA
jgi:UDP-N-acetylglucosamine transferase subunit ALG13